MRYFFLLFLPVVLLAQNEGTLRGTVAQGETPLPLAGANVVLENTHRGTITDASGQFRLESVPPGTYTVITSFVGFETARHQITIRAAQITDMVVRLVPSVLRVHEVVVTATRARERETPVAFVNITRSEIERNYWAQDMPMLLAESPNVQAYSDNGNGIGYSYMKIRGFDQKRIAVMINGIPLNDAASHEVFWVDLPDFASSVQDIQIQRGVGNSLYGAAAFGGSVNVLTTGATSTRRIELSGGWGSYNTRKYTFAANSGLFENRYALYGRFSSIKTDGYRQQSWSDLWSYFIGLGRYDENMVTRINIYGGPERSHLAYNGIDRRTLDTNRTYNPLSYPNEIDVFNQPHYELLHDWQLTPEIRLENSLFYFQGNGHYTQFRIRRKMKEFFGVDTVFQGTTFITRTDLVRKRLVDQADYGWIPRVTFSHGQGDLTLGGEIRIHNSRHYGEVVWAAIVPPGSKPDFRYYDYSVPKHSFTVFLHEMYRLTSDLTLKGDLQVRHHWIGLRNDQRFRTEFDRKYTFVNPRFGANLNVSDALNLFGSLSFAQREPAFKEIYNPQDYESRPYAGNKNFQSTPDGRFIFIGKSLEPEKLVDLEIGAGHRGPSHQIKLNLFWMNFRDAIVPTGQIDDNGVPISGNAIRTVHQGIEISSSIQPLEWLSFSGNLSYNDARFRNHMEYDFSGRQLEFSGNRIAGFPDWLGNLRVTTEYRGLFGSLHIQHVGKMFLDNTQNDARINRAFTVVNASIGYRLDGMGISAIETVFHLNNVGNRRYEAAGYVDVDSGIPYWIPAAERNFFLTVRALL